MIQVDVFWSFAMGAMYATASQHFYRNPKNDIVVNKYFIFNVLFLGIFFAPSGAYLLQEFPGWESMFYFRRADIQGILPAIFAATNVLLGVYGYLITAYLYSRNRPKLASSLAIYSYGIMFAILGFGYKRFLFAGTETEWHEYILQNKTSYVIQDFFQSEVFYTLLVMGVFIIPPLYYAVIFWPSISSAEKWKQIRSMIFHLLIIIILGCIGYSAFQFYYLPRFPSPYWQSLHSLNDFDFLLNYFEVKTTLSIDSFKNWSPLVGFVIAEISFFSLVILPHIFTFTVPSKSQKLKLKRK